MDKCCVAKLKYFKVYLCLVRKAPIFSKCVTQCNLTPTKGLRTRKSSLQFGRPSISRNGNNVFLFSAQFTFSFSLTYLLTTYHWKGNFCQFNFFYSKAEPVLANFGKSIIINNLYPSWGRSSYLGTGGAGFFQEKICFVFWKIWVKPGLFLHLFSSISKHWSHSRGNC